jgi:hypothetical protein
MRPMIEVSLLFWIKLRKPSIARLAHHISMNASHGAMSSVDVHHAANAYPDTIVAVMSYNVGILNAEIQSKKCKKWEKKYMKGIYCSASCGSL